MKLLEELQCELRPREEVEKDLRLQRYFAVKDHVWMVKTNANTQIDIWKPFGFHESYVCAIDSSTDDTEQIRFHLMAIEKPKRTPTSVYIQDLGNPSEVNVVNVRRRFGGMLDRDTELRRAVRGNAQLWLRFLGSEGKSHSIHTTEPDEFHAIDTVLVGGSTTAFNQVCTSSCIRDITLSTNYATI